MISEPELDGGSGFGGPAPLVEPPAPARPAGRRPWLWALGGALAASVVWGAGLSAYEQREDAGPDLRGYKPVEDPCTVAELPALAGALGERSQSGGSPVLSEPALHVAQCTVTFGPVDRGPQVSITYTLHKVTDPGPEFDARALDQGSIRTIDGLGERAFFDDRGEEGGLLRILDGQIEVDLDVSRQYVADADGTVEASEADLSGIEVPLTQDALALLTALKK
ncbi:hypothetical protein GCM10022244_41250 [Streptomyces gulbargensis]|uniref:DUF3558 domain-containing protein n=1 Tax=Streptomyces gulbargensis TaxID=364901 RepID=A0ABP7MSW9_9ACTN